MKKIKIISLCLLGAILVSCGTSSNVVSGRLISKRKVNKGFHINLGKNNKINKVEDVAQRNEFIQTEEVLNASFISENSFYNSPKEDIIFENEINNPTVSENGEVTLKKYPSLAEKIKISNSMQNSKEISINKKYGSVIKQKVIKQSHTEKRDDNELILLAILCFFLPPLAVFLKEGKTWTTKCTISLILTILFWIPGVIYSLLVVLDVI